MRMRANRMRAPPAHAPERPSYAAAPQLGAQVIAASVYLDAQLHLRPDLVVLP